MRSRTNSACFNRQSESIMSRTVSPHSQKLTDTACELSRSGVPVRDIARQLKITPSSVRSRLRQSGVPPANVKTKVSAGKWKSVLSQVRKLRKSGASWAQVAEDCAESIGSGERSIRATLQPEAFLRLLEASMELHETFDTFLTRAITERLDRIDKERDERQRNRKRANQCPGDPSINQQADDRSAEAGSSGDQCPEGERSSGDPLPDRDSTAAINQETEQVRDSAAPGSGAADSRASGLRGVASLPLDRLLQRLREWNPDSAAK